ncbi:gamma-1-syntrophin-like [Mytilus galloprovincialis]|uniref:gamma-1-syntrophin-like n=1 Tax=Mytilus galloprovincialis TaxID=29158 RepID=UPI003F7BDE9A
MEEVKSGMVSLHDGKSRPQPVKLHLTNDALILLKEELVPISQETEHQMKDLVREVSILREDNSGLGLSIKGGADHNLPPLISKLLPGSPAARTEQLFVGDAIIKINGEACDKMTHSEVMTTLKNAGSTVNLTVKYFKPAAPFLNKMMTPDSPSYNNQDSGSQCREMFPGLERQWRVYVSIQLLFAYLTRFCPGTDKLRTNAFEVIGVDGSSTGVIHCDDSHSLADWIRAISSNISFLISKMIRMSNRLLIPEEQILMMNWMHERVSPSLHRPAWKPKFVALKGPDIYLFDYPPMQTRDWVRCDTVFKVYECMLQICKDKELLDDRQHCCNILAGTGEKLYLSTESRAELLHLEKAWYRTNHSSITRLKHKTFGCTWRGNLCGLTLDLDSGFSLYDNSTKNFQWTYRFSQLRGSSDDGKTRLKLHFNCDPPGSTEIREIECTGLHTLLYSMNAFLSAKLASVDPTFLSSY